MTYRPYPSPTRARHQLDRHASGAPRATVPPSAVEAFAGLGAAMRAAQPTARQLVESWAAAFRPRPSSEEKTA